MPAARSAGIVRRLGESEELHPGPFLLDPFASRVVGAVCDHDLGLRAPFLERAQALAQVAVAVDRGHDHGQLRRHRALSMSSWPRASPRAQAMLNERISGSTPTARSRWRRRAATSRKIRIVIKSGYEGRGGDADHRPPGPEATAPLAAERAPVLEPLAHERRKACGAALLDDDLGRVPEHDVLLVKAPVHLRLPEPITVELACPVEQLALVRGVVAREVRAVVTLERSHVARVAAEVLGPVDETQALPGIDCARRPRRSEGAGRGSSAASRAPAPSVRSSARRSRPQTRRSRRARARARARLVARRNAPTETARVARAGSCVPRRRAPPHRRAAARARPGTPRAPRGARWSR